MNRVKTYSNIESPVLTNWIKDLKLLVKFRLTMLVVFTSLLAYGVAVGLNGNFITLAMLFVGGFLVTSAANALNEVVEKDFDAMMDRTKNRPIADGRMSVSQGVIIAGIALLLGIVLLSIIHPLTGLLGMLSVVLYAFVYTPMKRFTTLAVPVGAIAGAMPVLIGFVAGSGELTILAIVLFAIQFLWQFPHFWSVAFLSHKEYIDAGFKFLYSEEDGSPDRQLGLYSTIYAIILLALSVFALYLGLLGLIGGILLIAMSGYYAFSSYIFYKEFNRISARKLMFLSFAYIPFALVCFMLNGII